MVFEFLIVFFDNSEQRPLVPVCAVTHLSRLRSLRASHSHLWFLVAADSCEIYMHVRIRTQGLSVLGIPHPKILEQMKHEHCTCDDSADVFEAWNSGRFSIHLCVCMCVRMHTYLDTHTHVLSAHILN